MKKAIFTFVSMLCTYLMFAQAPQKFNYQAVARNASGGVLLNQNVQIRASILDGSPSGTSQYSETHSVTTNAQTGLFNLAIGGGSVVSGNFGGITWASGDKYLKIEMDATGGNNFTLVGTSQLLSVPYALNAGNGSQWKSNSNGIYYDAGNVGIGFPANSINNEKFAVNGGITSSSDVSGAAAFVANGLQSNASYLLLRGHEGSFSNITSSWSIYRAGFDKNKLIFRYGEGQFNPAYLAIDTTGKVGIGITNPQTRLSVSEQASFGNRIFVGMNSTEDGYSLLHFKNGTSNHGGIIRASKALNDGGDAPLLIQASEIGIDNNTHVNGLFSVVKNANTLFEMGGQFGGGPCPNCAVLRMYGNDGLIHARLEMNSLGKSFFTCDDLNVTGVKNFRIPYPEKPEKEIWYACIEGPEAAVYERGTIQFQNGQATVVLSEHFREVMNPATMTIQAIPLSADSKGLAIVEKNENGFIIKELWNGTGNYKVDWEVKAVRKGYENYRVVRNKDESLPILPNSPSKN